MIPVKCPQCPVAGECYGSGPLPNLCAWAASGDPRLSRDVVDRHQLPPPGGPAPALPPILTRIGNFLAAAIGHVAAGMPTLDAPAVAARLAVCEAPCPERTPGGACADCGCPMNAPAWRNKAHWADQDCPKGYWPAPRLNPPAPDAGGPG